MPKYQKIGLAILREIENNQYRLPFTQVELAEKYQVNRLTIRHALNWLEQSGQLSQVVGSLYSPPSPPPSAPKVGPRSAFPKIGIPIWLDSFADLDLPKNEAYLRITRHIQMELLNRGYQLDMQCVGRRYSPNLPLIEELCKTWKGIILEPMDGDSQLYPYHPFASMFPKAAVIGLLENRRYNSVYPDYYSGVQQAVQEFIRNGCFKILYTGNEHETISHAFVRVAAAEIASNRYPGTELFYAGGGFHAEEVFGAIKRFFQKVAAATPSWQAQAMPPREPSVRWWTWACAFLKIFR